MATRPAVIQSAGGGSVTDVTVAKVISSQTEQIT